MADDTSSTGGVRPASGTPEIGAPETDERSVTKTTKRSLNLSASVDDSEIEELRHALAKANKDAADHRKKLTAYEAAEQAARDAQLTETERLNKQYAQLQEQQEQLVVELAESRVREMVAGHASKFNFAIGARTLANLILADFDAIEFEDGQPANIEQLLEKLAKHEPELVKPAQTAQLPAQSRPPALPAMNQRATIPSPGQGQTGKPPRLSDPGMWKK